MPRVNNDERNQAIWMLNAYMSATVVSRHFGFTRKTIEYLRRRFRITRNVADRHHPKSGRPRVTTVDNKRGFQAKIPRLSQNPIFVPKNSNI